MIAAVQINVYMKQKDGSMKENYKNDCCGNERG